MFIFTLLLILMLAFTRAYSQEDMQIVDNSAFTKAERVPSVFRHDEHNEIAEIEECNECHHVYEDGKKLADETSEDQMCSDCHGLESEGGKPSLLKAFHLNCKGCHKQNKNGPITCGECHVR
ncbi:MAG: cytochrome c3 family protein [Deltaproteobacteria bacterium]|nr:cytochrome c3 family protein [Deltaproteobacteria bacterium]